MKAQASEMIEGQEAWQRFHDAMRAVVSVPKSAIIKDDEKRAKARKKKAGSPNNSRWS
jgi:hypothetical protein